MLILHPLLLCLLLMVTVWIRRRQNESIINVKNTNQSNHSNSIADRSCLSTKKFQYYGGFMGALGMRVSFAAIFTDAGNFVRTVWRYCRGIADIAGYLINRRSVYPFSL